MSFDLGFLLSLANPILTSVGVLFGIYALMKYLQKGESGYKTSKDEIKYFESIISAKLEVFKKELSEVNISDFPISKEQQIEIVKTLKNKLINETGSSVIDDIKSNVQEKLLVNEKFKFLIDQENSTIDRLKEELFSLSKRGNLNLSIGIMTTIIGLGLLGVIVLSGKTYSGSTALTENFLIEFLPRISFVILIEVFAYFFLRLYKENISEIKYFQNEITTIESKYFALRVAIEIGDKESIKDSIKSLSTSERNFILSKGQTTVDLERKKVEQQSSSDVLGKITELIGKKSSTK